MILKRRLISSVFNFRVSLKTLIFVFIIRIFNASFLRTILMIAFLLVLFVNIVVVLVFCVRRLAVFFDFV